MDELMLLRLTGSGFGSTFDLIILIAFIAFGVVYLLVPVLAHTRDRPIALGLSLYLLIGCVAVSLVQSLFQWIQLLDGQRPGNFNPFQGGPGLGIGIHIVFLIGAVKGILLLLSMLCFAVGLQAIRWREADTQAFEQAVSKLQQLRDENVRLRKRLEQTDARDELGDDLS